MSEDLFKAHLKKYAVPKEFDEAKQIKIMDFKRYTNDEIQAMQEGRKLMYPVKSGFIYRMTFLQNDPATEVDVERIMDMNTTYFEEDLSKYGIAKGDTGLLQRKHNGRRFTWEFKKL